MPGVVVEFIRKYMPILDTKTIEVALTDIDKELEWNNVDDPTMWRTLKKELEIRLAYLHERSNIVEKLNNNEG